MNEAVKTGKDNGSQMRITPDEMKLIKATFLNNDTLLKLMRKMFLPELDPKAPVGQMIDLYRTIPTKDRDPVSVTVDLMARNMVIDHVDQVLMQLYLMARMDTETPEQAKAKLTANSSK